MEKCELLDGIARISFIGSLLKLELCAKVVQPLAVHRFIDGLTYQIRK